MVTLEMLAEAVSRMRKAQKEYFLRRSNNLLNEAKKAEAEVDAILKAMAPTNVAIRADQGFQADLFG